MLWGTLRISGVPTMTKRTSRTAASRALRELVDANLAEQELRDRAPGGQLVAMDFPGIGQLGAVGGPAKFWFEHAERHGYLADEDVFPAAAL